MACLVLLARAFEGVITKMKKTVVAILAVSCCAFVAQQAQAVSGTISFSGASTASRASKSGKTTTVGFTNPWHTMAGGTDNYAAVPGGVATTMKTISFTGTGIGAVLTAPVIPQWTFTFGGKTYSFDLTSLISATTTSTTIAMSGTGTAFINGKGSDATWALEGTGGKFKFTASFISTSAVPDGGSAVALLGGALVLIEGVRRLTRVHKA